MPMVEPTSDTRMCASCTKDLSTRYNCPHREGYCVDCCSCIRCGDCNTSHLLATMPLEEYVQTIGMTVEQFIQRCTFKRVVGLKAKMTIGEVSRTAGGWGPPCKTCVIGRKHWLTFKPPAKIAVTEYKEDNADNDNSSSKPEKFTTGEVIIFERRKPTFMGGEPSARVPMNRYISAEIEVQGGGSYELNEIVKRRGGCIVTDGSVHGGMEICTGPAVGKLFEEGIEEITSEVRAGHGYITDQCGLHLHFDARDMTEEQLYRMGYLWVFFEPQLVAMQPASRRQADSGYCRPIGPKWRVGQLGTKTQSQQLGFMVTGKLTEFATISARGHSNDRYRTLNYCSFFKHSTLEVRLASGTLMPHKIINWAVVCGSILHAAINMKPEEIVALEAAAGSYRDKLISLMLTDDAKKYIVERQTKFSSLNTPEKMAKYFDPIRDYRNYVAQMRQS